jgi:26S proteasome regulatory subunit N2
VLRACAQVDCKCRPSLFAYPPHVRQEASAAAAKLPTAVLSTTARARDKARRKEAALERGRSGLSGLDTPKASGLETPKASDAAGV